MKDSKDSLGDRMKGYESLTVTRIPKNSYMVIRLDGKAFHTYTKGFKRPFDKKLVSAMQETTKYLCESIQGVKFGYTQSDEITLIITDFDKEGTQQLFDGKIQKITSITASMATMKFNHIMRESNNIDRFGMFDSRVFAFERDNKDYDALEEAINCVIWRQQDCIRNSVSMVAQSVFSHTQLHKKNVKDMLQMLKDSDELDWDKYKNFLRVGTAVRKVDKSYIVPAGPHKAKKVNRKKFEIDLEMSIISDNKEYLRDILKINVPEVSH